MSEPVGSRHNGQLFEEAAAWFARMRGPDAEASRADFEKWLSLGALHRSAYNRAAEIFAMGKLLHDEQDAASPAAKHAPRRRTLLKVGAVSMMVTGLASAGWFSLRQSADRSRGIELAGTTAPAITTLLLTSPPDAGASYRLADGSIVRLAHAAKLSIDLTPQARRLVLSSGEGWFEVAHEARPFIVYAGGGSVTAHGTIFSVMVTDGRRVNVRLIQGSIDVAAPPTGRVTSSRRLIAGEATSYAIAEGAPTPEQTPQPAVPQSGALDYDGARLGNLVDAANRLSRRPIKLSPGLADRKVSGHFRIDDNDVLAERIGALFDLSVDRSDPHIIVLKPR